MKIVYFMTLLTLSTAVLATDSDIVNCSTKKDCNDVVEVQGSLKFSRPALEFLSVFQQKINSDNGSLQFKFSLCLDEDRLFITITAPRDRKDLAEFTIHSLVNNYAELHMPYNDTQINSIFKILQTSPSSERTVLVNRSTRTLYIAGHKEACEELFNKFIDEMTDIILLPNILVKQQ